MLTSSKVTQKGQATIPVHIRSFLNLDTGDSVAFFIEGDKVVLIKADISNDVYLRSVESTLKDEWLSEEDSKAYDDL